MWSYLIRRILSVIPVLLVVATIVFLMLRLTPGDPAANIAGDAATTEDIAKLRVDLGLEEPLPVQFAIYIKNIVKGCLLYTSPSPRDRQKSRMPSSA